MPGKVEVRGDLVGRAIAKGAPAPRVVAAAATDARHLRAPRRRRRRRVRRLQGRRGARSSPRSTADASTASPASPDPSSSPRRTTNRRRERRTPRRRRASPPRELARRLHRRGERARAECSRRTPRRGAPPPPPAASSSPRARARGQLGRVGPASPPRLAASPRCAPAPVRMPRGARGARRRLRRGVARVRDHGRGRRRRVGPQQPGQLGLDVDATRSAGGNGCAFVPGSSPRSQARRRASDVRRAPHRRAARVRAGRCGRSRADGSASRRAPPGGCALEMGDAAVSEPAPVAFPPGVRAADVPAGISRSAATDAAKEWMWGSASGHCRAAGTTSEDVMRPCAASRRRRPTRNWRTKEQTRPLHRGAAVIVIATPGHAGEWAAAASTQTAPPGREVRAERGEHEASRRSRAGAETPILGPPTTDSLLYYVFNIALSR